MVPTNIKHCIGKTQNNLEKEFTNTNYQSKLTMEKLFSPTC